MQQKSAAKPISRRTTALLVLVSDLASRVVGTASTAPPPLDNRSPTLVLRHSLGGVSNV